MFEREGKDHNRQPEENFLLKLIAASLFFFFFYKIKVIKRKFKNESGMGHKIDKSAKVIISGKVLTISTDSR